MDSLSDKIEKGFHSYIKAKYVRACFKELKEEFSPENNTREFGQNEIIQIINKHAGPKLV